MNETIGFTITRTYDAPRALVWRAISEPDLFAQWFGTRALPVEIHSWDLREGGEWTGTMTYEGNKMPWMGRFIEIDEPNRLVVAITDEGELRDPLETVTYVLRGDGDSTELECTQAGGNLSPEQYLQAKEGTEAFLEAIAEVLAELR